MAELTRKLVNCLNRANTELSKDVCSAVYKDNLKNFEKLQLTIIASILLYLNGQGIKNLCDISPKFDKIICNPSKGMNEIWRKLIKSKYSTEFGDFEGYDNVYYELRRRIEKIDPSQGYTLGQKIERVTKDPTLKLYFSKHQDILIGSEITGRIHIDDKYIYAVISGLFRKELIELGKYYAKIHKLDKAGWDIEAPKRLLHVSLMSKKESGMTKDQFLDFAKKHDGKLIKLVVGDVYHIQTGGNHGWIVVNVVITKSDYDWKCPKEKCHITIGHAYVDSLY